MMSTSSRTDLGLTSPSVGTGTIADGPAVRRPEADSSGAAAGRLVEVELPCIRLDPVPT